MKKDEKIVIEDSRTIYSLAMVAILYQFLFTENLFTQNFLGGLKTLFGLMFSIQISFLLLRGVLLTEVNDTYKEKFLKCSDKLYAISFQLPFIFLIVALSLPIFEYIFNYLDIVKTIPTKILFFTIFLSLVWISIYIWKKIFVISQTKNIIYFFTALWIVYAFFIFMNL